MPFKAVLAPIVLLAFGAALLFWAVNDAISRRKSPLLVVIAVVFFFPFGLIAWLLFRPDVAEAQLNRGLR
jgi:hypothetical protein